MSVDPIPPMDMIRELRLRQWARQNFVPEMARQMTWHPVVLDEMHRRDLELLSPQINASAEHVVTKSFDVASVSTLMNQSVDYQEVSYHDFGGEAYGDSGSSFVPLAPTETWELHPGSKELPRPHIGLRTSDSLASVEVSDGQATV